MPKRGNGEGHIRQRKDGRWEAQVSVGIDPNTGKAIRQSIYGQTQGEVKKALLELRKQLEDGTYIAPDNATVGEWLQMWFEVYFKPMHRESTSTVYDCNITAYLIPALGCVRLQKLRVEQIQAFVNEQNKTKCPSSIHKMIEVLRAAFKQAVKNGILMKNPCENVVLPKLQQKEIECLTESEQIALTEVLPDTDNARALRFMLLTGLRVSELCGLRWVDIEEDYFNVRQGIVRTKNFDYVEGENKTHLNTDTVKSRASIRQIPIMPQVQAILLLQRKLFVERKIAAGSLWEDGDYVFSSEIGTPKDSANLRRTLSDNLKRAGLKHRGVHALRHSFATNAVRAGVDVRTLGELIGHTKMAFTIQTYVHSNMETKRRALEAISR